MTHRYWIRAGARNIRLTTEHGAQKFHFRRKSWFLKNIDLIWAVIIIALMVTYNF